MSTEHTTSSALREEIQQLTDSLSGQTAEALAEIEYRIYVLEKIRRGLADIEAGRVVSHEEAKRSLAKWLC